MAQKLQGRFIWLLNEQMKQFGIDEQEIDPEINYFENKTAIEKRFGITLCLSQNALDAKKAREAREIEKRFEKDEADRLIIEALNAFVERGVMKCPLCNKYYSSRVTEWVSHMSDCAKKRRL